VLRGIHERFLIEDRMLSPAQRGFVELLVARQALKFGDFTLKSGRKSPYFINTGCFHQGGDLAKLGAAYAATILARFGDDVRVVFGPAYKGIPLALAAAAEYERLVGRGVGWTYDRKEAKDHGDGGLFVGAPLTPDTRLVIVDDVLTAGTALRESLAKLKPTGVRILGAVVAVDRQEKAQGSRTAIEDIQDELGVTVAPIISITEAADFLVGNQVDGRSYLSASERERIARHLAG
jgi:orotate phosphoribosyltransferase